MSANNLNKLYLLYFSLAKDFHIFATFFDIISGIDMLALLFFIKDYLKKSIKYTQFSGIMERKIKTLSIQVTETERATNLIYCT